MKDPVFVAIMTMVALIELGFFGYFYLCGAHGHTKIQKLTDSQYALEAVVAQVRGEVKELEERLYEYKTYPYYTEKIIREQLQMMRPDEIIYKLS